MTMTATKPAAKAAPDQSAKQPALGQMSMEELGREYDRLNTVLMEKQGERDVVQVEMQRRLGGTVDVTAITNGLPAKLDKVTKPAQKVVQGKAPEAEEEKAAATGEEKPAGGKQMKGQWKPAILVFLRDRQDRGTKLKEMTAMCIEKVRSGEIKTKVASNDNPQVAQNVSQSLNAMKKDELVRQDENKDYWITQEGVEWLELHGLL
jgi:hypothetical protein